MFLLITDYNISNLLNIFMCLFKNRIHEYFDINFFKNKESGKMSAKSSHVQKTSGSESTNSPALSSPLLFNY